MSSINWNRRGFLRNLGLGAAGGLFLPMLSRLHAQQSPPKRFVFVLQGNGIENHNFKSEGVANASSLTAPTVYPTLQAPALAALAGATDELDLRPHSTALLGLSSKITGGSHTAQFKALTCSTDRRQTIDSAIADSLYSGQVFRALRLGVGQRQDAQLQYNICYQSARAQLPIIINPTDAHSYLFGSISTGAGGQAFLNQGELLNFAATDARRVLNSFSGSSQERAKVENYLSALEELQSEQTRLLDVAGDLQSLATQEGIDVNNGTILNSPHPTERLRSQFDLATAALIGGLTDVVVLTNSVGSEFAYTYYTAPRFDPLFNLDSSFNGTVPWRHGVCHGASVSAGYQAVLDEVIKIDVELVARLARRLAAVPEGDGTMLDNTVIVLMSDNGDTHHSQAGNWPALVVGGAGMGLAAGGRTIAYPHWQNSGNRRVSNLFNTLGHAAGMDLNDWGGEPDKEFYAGPLSELMA